MAETPIRRQLGWILLGAGLALACAGAGASERDRDARGLGGGATAGAAGSGAVMPRAGGAAGSAAASGGAAASAAASGAGTAAGASASLAGSAGTTDEAPYANVTAVTAVEAADGWQLSVSVESADLDCTQFADWWEVLSPAGALLYRRILEHSHTDANGTSDPDAPGNTFTRSGGPVPVDTTDEVLVRAHMSRGGYHGQVMRGGVEAGFVEAPDIGDDFASDVEDDEPQPTGCLF